MKFGGGLVTSAKSSIPIIGKDFTWTGGVGTYQVMDDGGGNWRIKFLSSGTFTPLKDMVIDAFLVGGGGGAYATTGGGGGGGYTKTVTKLVLEPGSYQINVGAGGAVNADGGVTSAFNQTANGGKTGAQFASGDGGSGGGSYSSTDVAPFYPAGKGGSDGTNGEGSANHPGGVGQGTTTREFGESDGELYAGGGGGSYSSDHGAAGGAGGGGAGRNQGVPGESGTPNTGGGAGAGCGASGTGGSGIAIIRNARG